MATLHPGSGKPCGEDSITEVSRIAMLGRLAGWCDSLAGWLSGELGQPGNPTGWLSGELGLLSRGPGVANRRLNSNGFLVSAWEALGGVKTTVFHR